MPIIQSMLRTILILLPLTVVIFWHVGNKTYPTNDEGLYAQTAQEIYLTIKHEGLLSGVKALYLHRVYKPILHPILLVPFLLFSGGNVVSSIAAYSICIYGVFIFMIYCLLKLYLTSNQAVAGTLIISTLPWIQQLPLSFNSEMPLMLCAVAIFYFRSRKYDRLLGICLGLSLCVRPVETLLCFGPPLILIMLTKKKERVYLPFVIFFVMGLIWYAPFTEELYGWIHRATFGGFTKVTGHRDGMGTFEFLVYALKNLGGMSGLYLTLGALFIWGAGKFLKKNQKIPKDALLVGATIIFLPLLVGATTYNADLRYYFTGTLLFFLALVIYILRNPFIHLIYKFLFFIPLLFLQTLASISIASGTMLLPYSFQPWRELPYHYALPNQKEETRISLFNQLRENLNEKKELHICILQMREFTYLDWVADPWALNILTQERGLPWIFARPAPHDALTPQERFKNLQSSCHYFMVMSLRWQPAPLEHFMSDVGELILTAEKNRGLKSLSLSSIGEFPYSSPMGQTNTYLLLKNDLLSP